MTVNKQQPSNLASTNTNKTTEFFSNFFVPDYTVSPNVNDSIIGFFEEQTGSKESAKLLTQTIINVAQAQREDPMAVLDKFRQMPKGELNAILALYLNSTRVNTSFLGIKNAPKTNQFVKRSILP